MDASAVLIWSLAVVIQQSSDFVLAELTITDSKGNTHLLDGYEAHYQFMSSMEAVIEGKVNQTLKYILPYSKEEIGYFLSHIDAINYSFLQFFHSLLTNDISVGNFFAGYFPSNDTVFTNWLRTKIKLPHGHVYKVVQTISQGPKIGLSSIPRFILNDIIKMNEKYHYFRSACHKGDKDVIEWAIQNGIPMEQFAMEAIVTAWEGKQWEIVKILLENGAIANSNITEKILNLTNDRNETLLHFAAETDNPENVMSLLRAGANVDALDIFGKTPLQRAIECNKESAIQTLLSNGANTNHETESADSLLHVAAFRGNYIAANLLIKEGFQIDRKNKDGFTPLHIAERAGVVVILNQLLAKCANFNKYKDVLNDLFEIRYSLKNEDLCAFGKGIEEGSPMMLRNLTNFVKRLIKGGAQSNLGYTIKSTLFFSAIENELSEAVHFLLETKLHNSNISFGLHKAVLNGEIHTIKYLLEAGADITQTNTDGWKPIHIAGANGNVKVVAYLLEKGDDVNSKTLKNETVLYISTLEGQTHVVHLLLEKGANINLQSAEGWQAIHAASWKGWAHLVEHLLSKGANPNARDSRKKTPLFEAARAGHEQVVKILLDNGATVNSPVEGAQTALHGAVWGGNPQVILLLLNRGANINAKDIYNKTALYVASYYGILDAVRILLKRGAKVNTPGIGGWTPLHIASRGGFTQIVKLLIDNGAIVNSMTKENCTSLYEAALHGHTDVVNVLLDNGADINAANAEGETPLKAARRRAFGNVVNILKRKGAKEIP